MRLAFDIETNGLLDTMDTIHCLVTKDIDTGDIQQYHGDTIPAGIKTLEAAAEVIGHNILAFDIPAIRLVYPDLRMGGKVTDTLVLSRVIRADLKNEDFDTNWAEGSSLTPLPKRNYGSHSLRAWGIRLGNHKGDYEGGWETFSQEMLDYCVQDVEVTHNLYNHLEPWNYSAAALELEHDLAYICDEIGNNGWTFDEKKAGELYADLCQERLAVNEELQDLFEPWEVTEEFIPKVNNKKLGYEKGVPFIKRKTVYFNPGSRRQIEFCLRKKYGWKPKVMTAGGHAQIDEVILGELHYPEAKKLAHYFLLTKRLGQLAEGPQAWMKLVTDKQRIHHTINGQGTQTRRAVHSRPNLGQVPAVRLPYGKRCRELFTVPKGYSLVGSDLAGLELRCLAHYMNDPEYTRVLLEEDVHTANQKAAGLPSRDLSKTFIYAWLYGAGDAKIGSIVGGGAKQGKQLKERFMKSLPAMGRLKTAVDRAAERGYLVGLDGGNVKVRSPHAALNTLLQSCGAILSKAWLQNVFHQIKEEQLDAYIVAWVHDEVQIAVREGLEDHVGDITRRSAEEAGKRFNFRCPIEADYQVGRTWADTH